MFCLRLCLFLWLSPNVIFQDRVVQGFLRWGPFGGAGEHQSLDSVPWNSREFHNTQQNVQNDEQNHNVHSSHPVNSDFSNQMHEEYSNWAAEDEISPLGEWYNHPDSAPNLEEVMNSYHQDTWNSAPVDHSIFSGQIHQQQTYPHKVSTQDQGSSSNNVQPNYDGDVFGDNYGNFVQHFNQFRYPDSSFEHHPHQNFEISHDEQMTQYPAFHSMQNDLSYSPHHSDVRNRGYQDQDWQVSDFNPASSSNNYGSLDTGAAIDHGINSIDNKNLIYDTSKNSMIEEAHWQYEEKLLFSGEGKSKLISILENEFSKNLRGTELEFMSYESKGVNVGQLKSVNKKVVDFIYQQAEPITKKKLIRANSAKNAKLKKYTVIDYTIHIDWQGAVALKIEICNFADTLKKYRNSPKSRGSTENHIKKISIWGITFMKIIAKMYSNNKASEFFGKCSQEDTRHFISTKFLDELNTPGNIFSRIKQKITGGTEMQVTYMFSWYFVFFRAMVYYPHLIFDDKINSGRQLKGFIEDGIVSFFEHGQEV
ncbi:expressed protein [Phakopsora pachyrhizi]|uniref:Expressed protein n=1 Tax=Phakopsora pachyrhizi TaxID=170000 RepID=A0AAV0AN93_PHAPC|nr:expressed protein [Phakopsora pachyrhizi]